MSAQKYNFAFLLLIICLLFTQSTASGCVLKGYCTTDDICKHLCGGQGVDPKFQLCVPYSSKGGKCCCLHYDGAPSSSEDI
ncbi:PREDICTED: defensin-like protein 276 [Camelina sativa]|uniref:Defensin-like protein 276 n=1 Tax=Camelina sativa TaxID=90675 RepID=A0ABM1QDV6_CAMSA|nr:PREDICTED: defensin-like protein 276 [Camelina sativa]